MSIRRMADVWELDCGSHSTKLVLLAIADNANDDGVAWPGLGHLARKTNLTERGVMKIIDRIEEAGWLEREKRDGKTTIYHLKHPFVPISGSEIGNGPLNGVRGSSPPTPEPGSPLNDVHPRTGDRGTPEPGSPPPLNGVQGTPERGSPEPSITVRGTEKEPSIHTPTPAREGGENPQGFVESSTPLPQPGFPEKQAVLDHCVARGWPVESGLAFWLHYDQKRSDGEPVGGPNWHWWSKLELWVMTDARKDAGKGRGSSPRRTPTESDAAKAERFKEGSW